MKGLLKEPIRDKQTKLPKTNVILRGDRSLDTSYVRVMEKTHSGLSTSNVRVPDETETMKTS